MSDVKAAVPFALMRDVLAELVSLAETLGREDRDELDVLIGRVCEITGATGPLVGKITLDGTWFKHETLGLPDRPKPDHEIAAWVSRTDLDYKAGRAVTDAEAERFRYAILASTLGEVVSTVLGEIVDGEPS